MFERKSKIKYFSIDGRLMSRKNVNGFFFFMKHMHYFQEYMNVMCVRHVCMRNNVCHVSVL